MIKKKTVIKVNIENYLFLYIFFAVTAHVATSPRP